MVNAIAAGASAQHRCFVKSDNTVWCVGSNLEGQLGIGVKGVQQSPTPVPFAQ